MKKFLVAAMMVLGATSAFAGDSDALKAVMKAKSYAEAEALVKQNLGQMANDAFIYNFAKSKRLDMREFDKNLHSPDNYKKLDNIINRLVERGLMATPTIIINDRLVYVTNSYEELSKLLEREL